MLYARVLRKIFDFDAIHKGFKDSFDLNATHKVLTEICDLNAIREGF